MSSTRENRSTGRRSSSRRMTSSSYLHQVTFCSDCGEVIPAKAHTCFKCGAKQPHAEDAVQVVFCDKCGRDFPARAMACHHCGHLNPHHPLVERA